MSETVNLELTGLIKPDADQKQAAQSLAALFRIEQHIAEALLAKAPTIIKKGLPAAQLPHYIAALNKAGFAAKGHAPAPAQPKLELVTEAAVAAPVNAAPQLESIETQMSCPQCGYQQAKRTLCQSCGCDMPRVMATQLSNPAAAAPQSLPAASKTQASRTKPVALDEVQYHTPSFWNVFDEGRLGRIRYLSYSLLSFIPLAVLGLVAGLSQIKSPGVLGWTLLAVAVIWSVVQSFRLTILRLHDMNKPTSWAGGLMLFNMITNAAGRNSHSSAVIIFGSLLQIGIMLALTLIPGDADENDYGYPAAPPNTWHKGIAIVLSVFMLITVIQLGLNDSGSTSHSSLNGPEVNRVLSEEEVQQIYQQHRHLVTEAELSKWQQELQLKHPDATIDREELRRNLQKEIDLNALDLARTLQHPNPSDALIPNRRVISEEDLNELMKEVGKARDISPKRELVRREAQYRLDQETIAKNKAAQGN